MRRLSRPGEMALSGQVARGFSASAAAASKKKKSEGSLSFDIISPYKKHLLDDYTLPEKVETTGEELLKFHRQMFGIRRMEIACDVAYKQKKIRGFLHLYDGQEAIAVGVNAALPTECSWITTYRNHGVAYVRGCSFEEIFMELFGFHGGVSHGKGGSMHMYNKKNHFYGGAAIVGAHVPVGAGLALKHQYKEDGNMSVVMYGDGSANQGQVYEAANMAALWNLPVVFLIENNDFAMGTPVDKGSASTQYYKQGNYVPGIKVDGMDVLATKAAMEFCHNYCTVEKKGPLFVEMKTYRFHGHSMSDPGLTYRTREEVKEVRETRDPIDLIKSRITESGVATAEELKAIEKEIRGEVNEALKKAEAGTLPPLEELYSDVYTTGKVVDDKLKMETETVKFTRFPDYTKSIHN
jgi:pyruvate dehydrogenase E1 component alpha subunit